MSNFLFWYVLVCNSVVYLKEKGFGVMYIAVTGSKNNKDVYIYQSYPSSTSEVFCMLSLYSFTIAILFCASVSAAPA